MNTETTHHIIKARSTLQIREAPVLLIIIICLAILSGCNSAQSPPDTRAGSASKLLSESIDKLNNSKSYRFTGTGSVQYINIAEQGNFNVSGEFKSPGQSFMTMELKLADAKYHSEIFYRSETMYQILDDSWKMVNFSPDTLIQPGFHPVSLVIDRIGSLALNPVFGKDEEYNGKKVIVINAKANQHQLKSYLKNQFANTAKLEPDRREGLMNFVNSCSVSQQYTFYIDPDSKQIVKLLFLQAVKISLSGKSSETRFSTTYYLSDFGAPVNFPAMPRKS